MSASVIYLLTVTAVLAVVTVALFLDFELMREEAETISEWLRKNPHAFIWPAITIIALLIALAVHLFMGRP